MRSVLILLTTLWFGALVAQDPPTKPEQDLKKEFLALLEKESIVLDEENKTVSVPATFNRLGDPLEYAVIHRRGKTHEALLYIESKPSILNSALLAVGMVPGKNATYKEKDPPPTREEVEAGADWVDVFPPEGMNVYMTVSWTDKDGEQHLLPIEDLILDMTTGKPVVGAEWIFIGGRMASIYRGEPPVYVADYEGNLVSICYLDPSNHLVTMKHEKARDDMIWWRTDASAPPGTKATLTFHRNKPKVVEEREKRLKGGEDGGD